MIASHQPKIFGPHIIAALSSVEDGNMRQGVDDELKVSDNCRSFLSTNMIAMAGTILCGVTYDRTDYTDYVVVDERDKGRGMVSGTDVIIADALATSDKKCALFLPLADCVGAIFYDPARQGKLMVAHLGRHSTEQHGAVKCVAFMKDQFGSKPEDLLVWISPSPNGTDYPIWKRDNKSFREATLDDLHAAGVTDNHIEMSDVDTVTDERYFSHSEYLKGHRTTDGRYAIVAMIR